MKMKDLINKLFLVGILSSFVLLYSCGDEDPEVPGPTTQAPSFTYSVTPNQAIDVAAGTVTVASGVETTWSFTVSFPGGFNRFAITNTADNSTIIDSNPNNLTGGNPAATVTANADNTQLDVSFVATLSGAGTLTLNVLAVDDDNLQADEDIVITITSPMAQVQTAVMLAAPLGNLMSQTFYSISEDQTYSVNDVTSTADPISANLDLGYFFGAMSEASLASVNDYPSNILDLSAFGTRNATSFSPVDGINITEVTTVADVEAILANVDFANADETVSGLAVDDIIAFNGDTGARGLIRVTALTPGDGENGSITLEFILGEQDN